MTALVSYSDSEADADDDEIHEQDDPLPPPSSNQKRKASDAVDSELPPLPSSFLDQYSSTVRTSTRDDPALHGGRKRATPHAAGNWPTHVYLEWHPNRTEAELLAQVVTSAQQSTGQTHPVHSLLQNDLGVPLPLHVSLSRPLVLQTAEKDSFSSRLVQSVNEARVKAFGVSPRDLAWHSNESDTRWFLVLRLQSSTAPELSRLLKVANGAARQYTQPTLYAEDGDAEGAGQADQFHISLAWSLQPHDSMTAETRQLDHERNARLHPVALDTLGSLRIRFSEVKVRIGQDVHCIALKAQRTVGTDVANDSSSSK